MIVFAWVAVLALLAVALAFWLWAHREVSFGERYEPFLRASDAARPGENPPRLSVLIPAHNEGLNLRRALDALLVQDYPAFEVIVASDRSTDDTVAIVREYAARDARVRLIENTERTEGWAGKSWVLHRASDEAKGELLLFLDADVALDPGALCVMVGHFLRSRLDFLSLYFRHEGSSGIEEIVHILIGVVVQLRYRVKEVNDPASPVAMANGQVILVRADVYRETGHQSIRRYQQEDLFLAKAVKASGRRIELAYGFEMGAARWYPSFGAMWHGWTRNVYGLAEGRLGPLFAGIALVLDVVLVPCATLAVSTAVMAAAGASAWAAAAFAGALVNVVLALWLFARLLRISRGRMSCLWLLPAACAVFTAILVANVFRRLTGVGIVWRGQRYHTGPDGLHAIDK